MSQKLCFVRPLLLAASLLGLVSCGTGGGAPELSAGDPGTTTSPKMKAFQTNTASSQTAPYSAMAASTMASSPTEPVSSEYRITPDDVLQVSIFQVPDLNRTVQVDGNGFISLPLVGGVPVRGKTLLQAQTDITGRYQKSYLQSPQVTVSLVKSGQRVTVSGAVKTPTVLGLDVPLSLSMAVAQSGGMGETGNPDRVHIARSTNGEAVEDSVHNLNDIQAGKAPNPMLRGGDIVVVEDSQARLALKNIKDVLPLAGVAALATMSDARAKRDIIPLAQWENGLQLYRYRYAWSDSDKMYVGVLAQEVREVAPYAVLRGADGYLRVDYVRLGLRMHTWDDWIALHSKQTN